MVIWIRVLVVEILSGLILDIFFERKLTDFANGLIMSELREKVSKPSVMTDNLGLSNSKDGVTIL